MQEKIGKLDHKHEVELLDRIVPDSQGTLTQENVNYIKQLERNNNIDFITFLSDIRMITDEQRDSLLNMVYSDDSENYIVVKEILKNKTDELAKMSPM